MSLKLKIPPGTKPNGQPIIILPLDNGTLHIGYPNTGGTAMAIGMMGNALELLAKITYDNEQQLQRVKERRVLIPAGNGRFH